ncbi:MAG TPA: hypothetical protein VFB03_00870, partial [Candidatus Saccharimonadales bacterium]|nr:hypothetical protein [Candidatus Saccharimonadales bacterium]
MSSDVWVDVSHIIGWQGNLTGIERVEYHLIKHYFYKTNARFFYFDLQKNYFIEADRRFVEKKIIRRTSEEEYSVKRSDKTLAQILRRKIARHSKARLNGTVIILAGLWDETAYISALEQLSTNNLLVHV